MIGVSAVGVRSMRSGAAMLAALLALAALAADPAQAAESYEYDAIGRLHRTVYANGGTIEYNYDGRGNIISIVRSLNATAVEPGTVPARFALGRATPNPGSGAMVFSFSLPQRERAILRVFDVAGRLVATLADGTYAAGTHVVRVSTPGWAGGVYLYRLQAGGLSATRKLVVAP